MRIITTLVYYTYLITFANCIFSGWGSWGSWGRLPYFGSRSAIESDETAIAKARMDALQNEQIAKEAIARSEADRIAREALVRAEADKIKKAAEVNDMVARSMYSSKSSSMASSYSRIGEGFSY